jgi:cobalt-zinc-cadmium efflux system outer membrane protein
MPPTQTTRWLLCLSALVGGTSSAWPAEPAASAPPETLTPEAAVHWALEYNPQIAALRQQHGIAAAGVVIAHTYPHNPVLESKVRYASGPFSAGVTNQVSNEHKVLLDVEVRGQWRLRREMAGAALSRADLEIADQEVALAVRVVRAFDTVVYRHRKRALLADTLELDRRAAEQVADLVNQGRLNPADLVIIQAEVEDFRGQLGPGEAALVASHQELARALGVTEGDFRLSNGFAFPPPLEGDPDQLQEAARRQRADLRAREAALSEADARLRLEVANRYGNPNVGPAYEYDPTRINLVGVQVSLPLPVFNTHRGEIQQREAERTRAALELRSAEIAVQQDVRAAVARLEQARKTVAVYQGQVRPALEKALKDIRTLFDARAAGADLLRVIDVQRKLLKVREAELDALFELRMALADLALAVGDPDLAIFSAARP